MPFSIAEKFVEYMQRMSEDKTALSKLTFSRTSATYITTHGVASGFKTELKQKMKGLLFFAKFRRSHGQNY